ncbi:alpha-amylase [Planktothricoides sp. SR001]|uniref:glycoside hydrolase family 13 protein n=1 Tax=Planktothricoides sp. SR001 TaxID=1705388 RepID=UPI0006C73546|nr:glycoside hydrolase family 13 protein [Planktothricoides sp. SR001]KOR37854.1 alpha-amylase [Planktothricoides sp. SR001]
MKIQTPDWVKQAVFYQIFPDRFAKSEPPAGKFCRQPGGGWQPEQLEPWDAPPTLQGYKGGNLWGVIEKLDYLQDLGINAIYFTPIFQSACNHRYHTHDYYQVDPILGGNQAFMALLDAAHQREIKVVLDGVFNHASRGFFFFNDILENGPNSPWVDWFLIENWPISAYDGSKLANYIGWANNRSLPKFNHDNSAVREYIMQIAEYWIQQGIDGWRLDVPYCVETPGFWQEFRQRVKAINPDAYIVGEVWKDSRQWLDGTQFDGVMNYLFTGPTIAFTAGDRVKMELVEHHEYYPYPALDAAGYAQKMQNLLNLYPWEIQLTQLNLLDSHDTARLLTICGEDLATIELATVLLMTSVGSPSIYYGDEVGLPGGDDPDCRRGFPPENQWNQSVLKMHKELIKLRRNYQCLQIGDYEIIGSQGMVYVFARNCPEESILVAINCGIESAIKSFSIRGEFKQNQRLYGQGQISCQDNQINLTLPPRSAIICI